LTCLSSFFEPHAINITLAGRALVLDEFGESFLERGTSLTDASSASAAAAEPSDEAE
jgi:hypothetical protein